MRFVHPEFLWFSLFALVPILLFFLNLQKVVKVDFTNVNFINELKKETSNRFKLKRILVMLARVLFVLFLVFAFAQPTFKKLSEIKAKHYIVYLDNSLSMTRKSGEGQLLDKAKILLETAVSNSSRNKFSLVTNSEQNINKDYPSRIALLKEVSSVKSSNAQLSLPELKALVRRKKTGLEKELVIISDFQESYFSKNNFEELVDTTADSKTVKLVSLEGGTENVLIDSVWVENKYLNVGSKVTVYARLMNNSSKDKDILVKCFSGNTQLSSVVVNSEANASVVFSLETPLSKSGNLPFRLSLEDPLVGFDNDYHFVLNVGKQIKVLVLHSGKRSYANLALLNESLFDVKAFNYRSFNSSELQDCNLLVLENIPDLNKLPREDIKKLILNGGNLFFTPSSKVSVPALNSFFKSLGLNGVRSTKNERLEIDSKSLERDPFFSGVFESTEQKIINPWFIPAFASIGGKSIIRSRIGTSFLTRERLGRGSVYILNTTLEDGFTNFHKHSLFVPTAYLIAMSSGASSENLAFSTSDESWLLKGVNPSAQENYLMLNSKVQYVPEQIVKRNDLEIFSQPQMQNGVYEIRSKNNKLTSIAVNYAKEESYLKPLNLDFLSDRDHVQVINTKEEVKEYSTDDKGFSWWKWLILVALFWLLVETALIRFFK